MPAIAVMMVSPQGTKTVRRSNSNGFANFVMSVFKENAHISNPGRYEFRVLVPENWLVTSGNAIQTNRFELLLGSIADIVAMELFSPVGLAQVLSVSGRISHGAMSDGQDRSDLELTAVSPLGERRVIEVGADCRYSFPAEQGRWVLNATSAKSGVGSTREFEVADTPVRLSTIVIGQQPAPPHPQSVTIDFEDVTPSTLAKVPSGVGGVDWNNLAAVEYLFYHGEGYINNAVSGHYVAYNGSGHPVTISRNGSFDFLGAYFGVAWMSAEGETLDIKAWRNGRVVNEESIPLSSLGPVWFDADFRGVDKVELATRHYWQFVVDDLRLAVPATPNPK